MTFAAREVVTRLSSNGLTKMKLTARQEQLLKQTHIDFQQTSEFLWNPLILKKVEG